MSQADKQDPEKGNVIGMFSTATLVSCCPRRPSLRGVILSLLFCPILSLIRLSRR
jgi:hypothetical protein